MSILAACIEFSFGTLVLQHLPLAHEDICSYLFTAMPRSYPYNKSCNFLGFPCSMLSIVGHMVCGIDYGSIIAIC